MATRSSVVIVAGASVLMTVAAMSIAKKAKLYFAKKPKLRVFRSNLLLSRRCAWLLSGSLL